MPDRSSPNPGTPPTSTAAPAPAPLVRAMQEIVRARTVSELAATVARTMRSLVDAMGAAFVVREGDACRYVDIESDQPLWKGQTFPLSACVCGWTIRNATPAIVVDVLADERIPAVYYKDKDIKSLLAVPIGGAGGPGEEGPIGALTVYWGERHLASAEEVEIARAVADAAAVQLENVRLMASLEASRRDAERRAAENAALNERLQHALVEEKRIREWARESESHLRNLADHMPVVLWATNEHGTPIYLNKRWEETTGLSIRDGLGDGWRATVHPDDLAPLWESFQNAVQGRTEWIYEYRQKNTAGQYRWVLATGRPWIGEQGRFLGLLGSVLDITERREMENAIRSSEQRLASMMRELDHRVKNNLAAVLSVCDQTFASTETMEAFRTAYRGRLQAMARTHEALAASKWTGAELSEIVATNVVSMVPDRTKRLVVEGPRTMLPAAAALPMAVTLHELATNALKYGAWSQARGEGRVEVRWDVRGEPGPNGSAAPRGKGRQLTLTWRESGGPEVRPPVREGFGMVLVQGMITYELGGDVDVRFPPTGLECDMTVLLDSERVSARPMQPAA